MSTIKKLLIDIGTKAKSCFIELLEASPVEKKFRQNCLEVSSIVHPSEIQAAIGVNYVEEWCLSLPLKEGRQGKFECHFKRHHRII